MAKQIKLSGRETAVLRGLGFGLGLSGAELQERVKMDGEDMVDILNTLLEIGYVETATMREHVTKENYAAEMFEVNPSYVVDLREALKR